MNKEKGTKFELKTLKMIIITIAFNSMKLSYQMQKIIALIAHNSQIKLQCRTLRSAQFNLMFSFILVLLLCVTCRR